MHRSKEIDEIQEKFNLKDQKFDKSFYHFHDSEMKEAKEKGEKDGRKHLPDYENTMNNPSEEDIRSSYQQQIHEVEDMGEPYLNELKDDWLMDFKDELDESTDKDREQRAIILQDRWETKLHELEMEKEEKISDLENKGEYKKAKRDYDRAYSEFEAICDKEGRRETDSNIKNIVYWVIFALIAFGEVGINYVVFELIGESRIATYFFAGFVGLMIAFAAHVVGGKIKRKGWKNPTNYIWIGSVVAYVIIIAVAVSNLREYYIADQDLLSEAMVENVGFLFICFSLMLFTIASVFAYLHHDSNPQFVKIKSWFEEKEKNYEEKQDKLERKIDRIKEEFRVKANKLDEKYELKIDNVEDEEDILRSLIHDVIAHYNSILHECQALEKKINESYKEAISEYRRANVKVRTADKLPDWHEVDNLELPMNEKSILTHLAYRSDNPRMN